MKNSVVEYYTETGLDYRTWSPEFNMHFGYWRWPMNPFRREPMLEAMNRAVVDALELTSQESTILDLGCGLGATMRSLARQIPKLKVRGFTIVPWQVETARELNANFGPRLEVRQGNYLELPVASGSVDGAYSLESSCYAPGECKSELLEELHRVLKPGSRFAVADGFTTTSEAERPRLLRPLLRWSREGWAVPCYASKTPFLNKLKSLGFVDIEVRDISWQIAPSVLHAPPTVFGFALKRLLQGEQLNAVRWQHLRACLVALAVGLFRAHFSYLLVRGRKP